jgi:hypothetical protein
MGKKPAIFDAYREIEGTSLSTTYANVGSTLASDAHIIHVFNTCDATVILSFDGGTTDHYKLDANEAFTLDLKTSQTVMAKGIQIQAKDAGSTPTAGSIRITIVRT